MNEKNIYIVTGPIQTGKTTRLFKFVNEHKSIDGILSPIVDEKRHLYHISSHTLKLLEVPKSNKTIAVGKYHFLKETFNWANEKLIESFNNSPEWLIIDEAGKLEMTNKGLNKAINYTLKNSKNSSTKIVLVIRDYLLNEILKKYKIWENEYKILNL